MADPSHWRSLLGPWLSRMRGFGPLSDTKIQLIVRNETEENPSNRKSRCQVSTFGDLLEYINNMEKLLKICPGLQRAMTNRRPFQFELGIKSPPPSVRFGSHLILRFVGSTHCWSGIAQSQMAIGVFGVGYALRVSVCGTVRTETQRRTDDTWNVLLLYLRTCTMTQI